MNQLDIHTAMAFQRLKAPDFASAISYVEKVHQKALEDMAVIADESQWRRLQGRAQMAKELLDLVKSSSELVTKLSRPQQ